jgi:hypothetical protein
MAGLAQQACEAVVSNLDLEPCVQQYLTLSQAGLVLLQWEGWTRASIIGAGAVGAGVVGTPAAHIHAMESWMSVMALVRVALVATRFLMVVFF